MLDRCAARENPKQMMGFASIAAGRWTLFKELFSIIKWMSTLLVPKRFACLGNRSSQLA